MRASRASLLPTGFSPSLIVASTTFGSRHAAYCTSYNPAASRRSRRFGLLPVRSPLLRESRLISLSRATEMFQFAHCPPGGLCVQPLVSSHHAGGVAPFGISGL